MPKRRHHASFLLCMAVASVALLCGCGARAAHTQQQQAARTPTTPTCAGVAASWAYLDTVAQLKRQAQVIVVGTVVSTRVGQDTTPCDLHTDATVRVDRSVYDPQQQVTGTTLVVRTEGGQLPGGVGEGVEDEAHLGAGDQIVLFLVPETAARYRVVDGEQGATHIIDGVVHPMSGPYSAMPLDAYIAQIEQA